MLKSYTTEEILSSADLNQLIKISGVDFGQVAGEAIDASSVPQVLYRHETFDDEEIVAQSLTTADSTYSSIYGTQMMFETFIPRKNTLTKTEHRLRKNGTPVGNVQVDIYATDANKKPTGSSLGSGTMLASLLSVSFDFYTIELDSEIPVTIGAKYAAVISAPSCTVPTDCVYWAFQTSDVYPSGEEGSGAVGSWSVNASSDAYLAVYGYNNLADARTAGRLYKAAANDVTKNIFAGFGITSAASAGNNIALQSSGIVSGFTNLIPGRDYFLQDTAGTIGLVRGTYAVKVGRARTATDLDLGIDIRQTFGTVAASGSGTVQTIAHGLGRKPRKVKITLFDVSNSGISGLSVGVYDLTKVNSAGAGNYPTSSNASGVNADFIIYKLNGSQPAGYGFLFVDNTNLVIEYSGSLGSNSGCVLLWEVES